MSRRIVLLLAVLVIVPAAAGAQDVCRETETTEDCWNRLDAEAESVKQKAVQKKTETGLDQLAGLSSGIKDFLPLLNLAGVLGPVQRDDQSGVVAVSLNTPFLGGSGGVTKDPSLQLKALIDTSASLFEPLKQQLPAEDRDALEKQLLGDGTGRENVTLEASYSFLGGRLGRNFEQYTPLFNRFYQSRIGQVPSAELGDRIRALTAALPGGLISKKWAELTDEQRRRAGAALLDVLAGETALNGNVRQAMRQSGLDMFGQLVNNQPQLYVTVGRAFRDELFGPDLLRGRISFEMGLGNSLNRALDEVGASSCQTNLSACLTAYTQFVNAGRTRAAIKAASRLSFFAEFVRNDAYHFVSPEPALDFAIAEGTGWSAGLDYGRLVGVDDDGTAAGRFDASVRWEAPADKAVDRRFVASLTLTKKLGDISIPFGLVYANKEKFLTGVDHGLSANVGLKFNLFPGMK
jgi:hypothetical protein